uniref:Uncharacterized protein n=1 Tax=mine drainage metagenome TaxID=410659 RepID=E6QQA0_9ZZZZ
MRPPILYDASGQLKLMFFATFLNKPSVVCLSQGPDQDESF